MIKDFDDGDSDKDKFLLIGPRHPLFGLKNQLLYIQTKLNSENAGYSFKPILQEWYNIQVSQFIENNEVQWTEKLKDDLF